MTNVVIASLAILLAFLLRSRRFAGLKSLALPFALTAVSTLGAGFVEIFQLNGPWERWTLIAVVISFSILGARVLLLIIFDWVLEHRMGITLPHLIRDVTALILYLSLGALFLPAVGLEVTGLIATSAVLTVVIGLAFQQTLGNLLAGLALAWEQRLPDGSWIEIDGRMARIRESGWRSMILQTRLGDRILIPNAEVAAASVVQLGAGQNPVAIPVRIGISYRTAPDLAKSVLMKVATDTPEVLSHPAPLVLTVEFADSAIVYECRLWTHTAWRRDNIIDAFLTRSYAALKRHDMEIPFPQRTIHRAGYSQGEDQGIRRREHLGKAPIFKGIPSEALETVAAHARLLRYTPGEAVVQEGDVSNALFLVVSGEAAVVSKGHEISRILEGEIFGEGAFLTGNPRSATVRAAESALEVIEINTRALGRLLEQHPAVTDQLAQRFADRQLEGEALHDESGVVLSPRGLVAHLRRTLARLVGSS